MSSGIKCKNCGSTDIEEDNARGDAVCTNCGSVLEDNLIVSEVQFEEVGHGSATIGQFVSSDSTGGATNYGYGKFQVGSGTESREVTIKKAKKGITLLCDQLQLSNHYIETALNFFKLALMRHLTKGRRNTHIYAACVYITCRTNGTSHLLIDISDVLQICCYELGRTYLKLSQALCINIPSIDPCLYVMRFANRLEFGDKTHEVATTALRVVQRMKKDSMHSGRRPTGLCGAALLIAARMHEFSRTILDLVKIVKIHESTLRKRLIEFADTPSSSLTLDEFMAVDLEAEQDPPAFKLSRKKDRERIQKIGDHELNSLQKEIDAQLEKDLRKSLKRSRLMVNDDFEEKDTNVFITESTMQTIEECLADDPPTTIIENKPKKYSEGLKPDIAAMCVPTIIASSEKNNDDENNGELNLEGLDDDEINGYIMTDAEAHSKNELWMKLNAEYLDEMKAKEEKLAKEKEEGKPERKKRRPRKKIIGPSNTAGEAIEKMLQEKKISNKINYDILKTLTEPKPQGNLSLENASEGLDNTPETETTEKPYIIETQPVVPKHNISKKAKFQMAGLPIVEETEKETNEPPPPIVVENDDIEEEDDIEDEPEPEPDMEHSSLKDMLNNGNDDDEYYGFDDEQY